MGRRGRQTGPLSPLAAPTGQWPPRCQPWPVSLAPEPTFPASVSNRLPLHDSGWGRGEPRCAFYHLHERLTPGGRGGPDPGASGFPCPARGSHKAAAFSGLELSRPETVLSQGWWEAMDQIPSFLVPLEGGSGDPLRPSTRGSPPRMSFGHSLP